MAVCCQVFPQRLRKNRSCDRSLGEPVNTVSSVRGFQHTVPTNTTQSGNRGNTSPRNLHIAAVMNSLNMLMIALNSISLRSKETLPYPRFNKGARSLAQRPKTGPLLKAATMAKATKRNLANISRKGEGRLKARRIQEEDTQPSVDERRMRQISE